MEVVAHAIRQEYKAGGLKIECKKDHCYKRKVSVCLENLKGPVKTLWQVKI